jgi:hypothetical protein
LRPRRRARRLPEWPLHLLRRLWWPWVRA